MHQSKPKGYCASISFSSLSTDSWLFFISFNFYGFIFSFNLIFDKHDSSSGTKAIFWYLITVVPRYEYDSEKVTIGSQLVPP